MNSVYDAALRQAMFGRDPEAGLSAAADCGHEFLKLGLSLESVNEIHHSALLKLSKDHPDLKFSDIVDRLMPPLIESSMAYSLALREEQAQKIERLQKKEQVSRLAAIGTLTAGIGHDFNTILGVVSGYAEMLCSQFQSDSTEFKKSQRILDASSRARDLIERMLMFARKAPVELQQLDAVALIKSELEMVREALPLGVQINFVNTMASAAVMATPSHLHEIVMNLCVNASHAMNGEGTLEVEIKQVLRRVHGVDGCQYLSLVVTDNGCGMSKAVQKRVLGPFFTTKELGKGTGLGLSVVFGIVTDLGGEIHIDSQIGGGARFSIDLPLVEMSDIARLTVK
jgi:signal transduction histidine kinase